MRWADHDAIALQPATPVASVAPGANCPRARRKGVQLVPADAISTFASRGPYKVDAGRAHRRGRCRQPAAGEATALADPANTVRADVLNLIDE
jgi:hypothetical protein